MPVTINVDFGGGTVRIGCHDTGTHTGAEGTPALVLREWPQSGEAGDLELVRQGGIELLAGRRCDAVSIAVPGVVDAHAGTLLGVHGKYQWAKGRDLRQWAADAFEVDRDRTCVENDARAALIGEASTGVAAGRRDVALLILGTGVGTAAMIDGVALRGRRGHAGNLGGHFTVGLDTTPAAATAPSSPEAATPRCNCGNVGCAEVFGGSWAIEPLLRRDPDWAGSALQQAAADTRLGFGELNRAAEQGDPVAVRTREIVLAAWCATAVNLCHGYDPEVLVLSGGPMAAADLVVPRIRNWLDEHLWSTLSTPEVLVADRPDQSVIGGLITLSGQAVAATEDAATEDQATKDKENSNHG